MTISASYAPNQDVGNGVTRTFTINFPFGAAGDLVVTLFDTVAQVDVSPAPVMGGGGTYDYTVAGTPDPDTGIYPNGSVTFTTAPLATHIAVRARATPQVQETVLTDNGRFPAKSVEGSFDRQEMQLQERADELDRAIKVQVVDGAGTDTTLPALAGHAGRAVVVNSSEDGFILDVPVSPVAPNVVAGQFATTSLLLTYWNNSFTLTNGATVVTGARSAVGDRGGAIFVYDNTDTTTADNAGTVRVDAANRRWKAAVGAVTPELFGAKGDGTTDDTTALQKALNWGGRIKLGPYSYAYTALTITVPVRIEGALQSALSNGAGGTLLLCSSAGAGDKITIGGLAYELSAVVIEHLCFSAPNATGGAVLFFNWVRDCLIRDVQMLNLHSTATGIKITQANTLRVYDTRIISPTTYGIYIYGDDSHRTDEIGLVNIIVSGDSTGAHSYIPAAICLDGFVNTVTGQHINCVDCGYGLLSQNTVGATSRGEYVFFHDLEVDYPYNEGIKLFYHDGCFFTDTYIHSSLTKGNVNIVNDSSQTTSNISFIGGQITSAFHEGIFADGRNMKFIGLQITGNGLAADNTYPGLRIGQNAIGAIVTGCCIGPMTGFFAEHQNYGVQVDAGATEYTVVGNHLKGNLTEGAHDFAFLGAVASSFDSTIWNNTGQITEQSMQLVTPAAGDTVNATGVQAMRVIGGSTLATLTVNLPPVAPPGMKFRFFTQPAITAVTFGPGTSRLFDTASVVTTMAANSAVEWRLNPADGQWFRFL